MGRSTEFYRKNKKARDKKAAYDKEFNKKPEQRKKRTELQRKRRAAKKRGVDTSKSDYDHAVGKRVPISVNRGRREKSRRKGSKRRRA